MKKAYVLIQRWFETGEGWAHTSEIPGSIEKAMYERIAQNMRDYSGTHDEKTCPLESGTLYVFIEPDSDCRDTKAVTRRPHIDIGIWVPAGYTYCDVEEIRKFALKIQANGVFDLPFAREDIGTGKIFALLFALLVLVVIIALVAVCFYNNLIPLPVTKSPVAESPVAESPVAESPVAESPVVESPVVESPVVESPVVESPVVESPVVESPVVESPVAESPVAESPVVESPVVESPVAESSVAESPSPALVDISQQEENRVIKAWNIAAFEPDAGQCYLEKFIEVVNKGCVLRSRVNQKNHQNGHPDIQFLIQRFPDKKLPVFLTKQVDKTEYDKNGKEIKDLLGNFSFTETERRFDYQTFFKKNELDKGMPLLPSGQEEAAFVRDFWKNTKSCKTAVKRRAEALAKGLDAKWDIQEEDYQKRPWYVIWLVLRQINPNKSMAEVFELTNSDENEYLNKLKNINPKWIFISNDEKKFNEEFSNMMRVYMRKQQTRKNNE